MPRAGGRASARRGSATRSSSSPATAATTSATTAWRSTTTHATGKLDGTAVISARATQSLARFDLDLRGFDVSQLLVDGRPAAYRRAGQELIVTPRQALRAGRDFTVLVRYAGVPEVIIDPDDSIEGWVPTADGAFVVGEPQGAPGWFPANDNPQDKATFDMAITVPDGITALGNGVLAGRFSHGGRTTWVWHEGDPMATYLATATNGRFNLTQTRVGGIPVYNAVDPTLAAELGPLLDEVPDIVRFFSALYGPYPVQRGGRDRRRRARRRLRAGDPDQAELRLRARRDDARARARAPVVRRRGHAAPVARHLAARGLRRMVGVDLGRAPRRPDRPAELRRGLQRPARCRHLGPAARPACRRPPSCSATRSTTAAR